jgi:hypothetical protein
MPVSIKSFQEIMTSLNTQNKGLGTDQVVTNMEQLSENLKQLF